MKLHNPKSFSPAVYIPCWLIQVDIKLLSLGAKMLYGRLSQWSNEKGIVFRSGNKLSQELGVCRRSIVGYLKELKDNNLIGVYLTELGGNNHYHFYDHPWMHVEINENLIYKDSSYIPAQKTVPLQDLAHPCAESCAPPAQDLAHPPAQNPAHINKNINKKEMCVDPLRSPPKKQHTHISFQTILEDTECVTMFERKFSSYNLNLEDLFNGCMNYYEGENKIVTIHKFRSWIENEKLTNYSKKEDRTKPNLSPEDFELVQNYKFNCDHPNLTPCKLTPEEEARAYELIKKSALHSVAKTQPNTQHPKNPIVIQGTIQSNPQTIPQTSQLPATKSAVMLEALEALKKFKGKMRVNPKPQSPQERKYYSSSEKKTEEFPSISLAEYRAMEG